MSKRTNKVAQAPRISAAELNPMADITSGRWATEKLKALSVAGRDLSSKALRTLDTLRHEEWKFFDDALLEEALIRLVGVADLQGRGLVKPVPNALGKMVFAYEKVNFMDDAQVSLDGLGGTANDRVEFSLGQSPLPIIHKDFFINLRTLAASREKGESLDTTQVRMAGRVVAEKAEYMLFNGGPTFGGMPIYGYTTFPDRNHAAFDGGKDWDDSSKAGSSYLTDAITAITALQGDRMYGPYVVYVPTTAGILIEKDFSSGTSDTRTIRQRLLQISQIADIRVADQLPTANVVFVQMTADNVVWVQGEDLQNVQWDEGAGFKINFKAWMIGAPLLRSTAAGRSGIFHFSDAG